MEINWFPGHMAKTLRKMKDQVKLVDLVIETCDARIPESSRNPELSRLISGKPHILVLNKADLADPEATRAWTQYYAHLGIQVIAIDSTRRAGPELVQDAAIALMQDKIDRSREKGRLFQPVRVMVAGIPNTGKSTLINTLVRRKVAQAQDKPGVTRSAAWVRSSGQLELLDTPGVLWPKLGSRSSQIVLAATGAIRDVVLDLEEVAARVLYQLDLHYPQLLAERYSVGQAADAATAPVPGANATPPASAALADSDANAASVASDSDTLADSVASPASAAVAAPAVRGSGSRPSGPDNEAPDASDAWGDGREDEPMLTADPELAGGHKLLSAAARKRGFLQTGGRTDTARFAVIFLDELRGGRIGRITLEWPPAQAARTRIRRGNEAGGVAGQNEGNGET